MSIFRDFFVKEKPFFTGITRGIGGFGFGGGAAGGDSFNPVSASGGVERTFGDYTFHVFTGNPTIDGASSPYTFSVTSGGGPNATFDLIMVAGGGGGGDDMPGSFGGGGGGAGGVRFIPELTLGNNPYPLVVAAGGSNANNGGDTIFNPGDGNSLPAITCKGGGYGGNGQAAGGANGGAGGGKDYPGPLTAFGAGNNGVNSGNAGGSPVGEPRASGPGSPVGDTRFQGSPGNARNADVTHAGGGGGGARYNPSTYYLPSGGYDSGPGIVVTDSNPDGADYRAQGGDGIDFGPIIGPYTTNGNYGDSSPRAQPGAWFGGGGHGGKYPGGPGAPGTGGIGGGGYDKPGDPWTGRVNKHGETNTGGGGAATNGNGGPGILIVRYKTAGGPTGS